MTVSLQNPSHQIQARAAAKVPAHEHVYQQLRQMIMFGDLAPGQAVTIQGLVDMLAAGMTPVREALRRLIAEGALIHQGNRRVSVPQLSATDVEELSFMRKTLEPELARRAASRFDAAGIAELTAIDARLNAAIDGGDVGGYLKHNHAFHNRIYAAAEAPIMIATVEGLWLRFGPSLRVVCGLFGTSNLPDKHRDMLDALRRGDADAVADAMTEDVQQGMNQILTALTNLPRPK